MQNDRRGKCVVCDQTTERFKSGRYRKRCGLHASSCHARQVDFEQRSGRCCFCGEPTAKTSQGKYRIRCYKHRRSGGPPVRSYLERIAYVADRRAKARVASIERRRVKRAEMRGRGLSSHRGKPLARRDSAYSKLAKTNARQAWRYWLDRLAPESWLASYWMATGKPWNRPGLSPGKKWRTRYEFDPVFRKIEYQRLQHNKRERLNWITSSVGALNARQVRSLREEATHCAECAVKFTSFRETTIDHIMALARGGRHVSDNVRVVCLPCNARLGARPRETESAERNYGPRNRITERRAPVDSRLL